MSAARHHVIAHRPGAFCIVSLFDRPRPVAVIAEHPDNRGVPAEAAFQDAVRRILHAYLAGRNAADVCWVYRGRGGQLFRARLWNDASVAGWGRLDRLEQVVDGGGAAGSAMVPDPVRLRAAAQWIFDNEQGNHRNEPPG